MLEIFAIAIPVIVTGIGGYVHLWVRSSVTATKVDTLEAARDDYNKGVKEFIDAKFEAMDSRFDAVDYRLARIEKSMNGHLRMD